MKDLKTKVKWGMSGIGSAYESCQHEYHDPDMWGDEQWERVNNAYERAHSAVAEVFAELEKYKLIAHELVEWYGEALVEYNKYMTPEEAIDAAWAAIQEGEGDL